MRSSADAPFSMTEIEWHSFWAFLETFRCHHLVSVSKVFGASTVLGNCVTLSHKIAVTPAHYPSAKLHSLIYNSTFATFLCGLGPFTAILDDKLPNLNLQLF